MSQTQFSTPSPTEIVITRTFGAPRANVWAAWTQCEHLVKWWHPDGWELTECEIDVRVGGSWRYCMKGPISETEIMESRGLATYSEVEAPERLVYTDEFADEDYNPVPGMPVATNTVTFTEENGVTTMHARTSYPTQEDRDKVIEMGVEEGVKQTYDRLEEHLRVTA
ncbi:MAG: SRPBCC domain-containing protein [Chloroflexota bacterium]